MAMATGEEGPPLRRPDALDNHEATQDHQRQRTNQYHPEQCTDPVKFSPPQPSDHPRAKDDGETAMEKAGR